MAKCCGEFTRAYLEEGAGGATWLWHGKLDPGNVILVTVSGPATTHSAGRKTHQQSVHFS
jgi:hypothetical protein